MQKKASLGMNFPIYNWKISELSEIAYKSIQAYQNI